MVRRSSIAVIAAIVCVLLIAVFLRLQRSAPNTQGVTDQALDHAEQNAYVGVPGGIPGSGIGEAGVPSPSFEARARVRWAAISASIKELYPPMPRPTVDEHRTERLRNMLRLSSISEFLAALVVGLESVEQEDGATWSLILDAYRGNDWKQLEAGRELLEFLSDRVGRLAASHASRTLAAYLLCAEAESLTWGWGAKTKDLSPYDLQLREGDILKVRDGLQQSIQENDQDLAIMLMRSLVPYLSTSTAARDYVRFLIRKGVANPAIENELAWALGKHKTFINADGSADPEMFEFLISLIPDGFSSAGIRAFSETPLMNGEGPQADRMVSVMVEKYYSDKPNPLEGSRRLFAENMAETIVMIDREEAASVLSNLLADSAVPISKKKSILDVVLRVAQGVWANPPHRYARASSSFSAAITSVQPELPADAELKVAVEECLKALKH